MALALSTGATMMCSFGVAPASLVVLPTKTIISGTPTANNTANAPVVNVPTFGACSSLANPTVASATSAALGVLTPMPCVPNTVAPWLPGPVKTINGGTPAVDQTCTLMCSWGGVITVVSPGQFKVVVS
ncbi:DUF4280 domain-containing protein [Paraliomyxa miuraensis]|uniref:DUF4280 domain-containing protein n=1 Tax=Paraliomyxa miuraensis TaxID=376150 RepID=UPI002259320F|nr:DUF4280 domain-containing protein [Paraliomyxa miuraensis]MCX4244126.1 DUF4280 domain-containing protein [Paraliomyxa miuraensis]